MSKGRSVPYWLQQACFKRDRWTCVACGFRGRPNKGELHCDHIRRRADGGADTLENVRTLCVDCHEWVTRKQNAAAARRPQRRRPRVRKARVHPADVLRAPQT